MSTRDTIADLYKQWLWRADPYTDTAGLNWYVSLHQDHGWSFDAIAQDLRNSPEAEKKYKEFIKNSYNEYLERDPDETGMNTYFNAMKNGSTQDYVNTELQNSKEYEDLQKGKTEAGIREDYITVHGEKIYLPVPRQGSEDYFGDSDYYYILNKAAGDGKHDFHVQDIDALKKARNDVFAWMQTPNGEKFLAEQNRKGGANKDGVPGLYDRIQNTYWDSETGEGVRFHAPDTEGSIMYHTFATDQDSNPKSFSYADVLAARAGGRSEYQIYQWMRFNKDTWEDVSVHHKDLYDSVREPLIDRAKHHGNMLGYEGWGQSPEIADKWFSWRNTLENPLWQELGDYMRAKKHGEHWEKDLNWWQTNKEAYYYLTNWLKDRKDNYDFIDEYGSGLFKQEHLDKITGGWKEGDPPDTDTPPGIDWEAGEYWSHWGEAGPDTLSDPQLMAAGVVFGKEYEEETTEKYLKRLEQKFLKEMFDGVDKPGTDDDLEPRYDDADDYWGLDIVRKGMRNADGAFLFEPDWYDEDTNTVDTSWWNKFAYGTKNDTDWAYYQGSELYKKAREALNMDSLIDTAQEIRQANVWVQGYLTKDVDSDLVDHHDKYVPKFNSATETPYTPKDLKIEGYNPAKPMTKKVPEPIEGTSITIPKTGTKRPDNLPHDSKIVDEGKTLDEIPILPTEGA